MDFFCGVRLIMRLYCYLHFYYRRDCVHFTGHGVPEVHLLILQENIICSILCRMNILGVILLFIIYFSGFFDL